MVFDTMVFNGRYKPVKVHKTEQDQTCGGELYDLQADPLETVNRHNDAEYRDIKIKLLKLVCDRKAQTCGPLPLRKAYR